jgi:hypothetical protein
MNAPSIPLSLSSFELLLLCAVMVVLSGFVAGWLSRW